MSIKRIALIANESLVNLFSFHELKLFMLLSTYWWIADVLLCFKELSKVSKVSADGSLLRRCSFFTVCSGDVGDVDAMKNLSAVLSHWIRKIRLTGMEGGGGGGKRKQQQKQRGWMKAMNLKTLAECVCGPEALVIGIYGAEALVRSICGPEAMVRGVCGAHSTSIWTQFKSMLA